MSCFGVFSAVLALLGTLMACSMAPLALAGLSGEFRTQIDQQIRRLEVARVGLRTLRKAVEIWVRTFVQLFGWKLLSWKFFIFTPVYALTISVLVMLVWIVPEYIRFYSIHSFGDPAYMSPPMKEGFASGSPLAFGSP
jgi:hypothetical protein